MITDHRIRGQQHRRSGELKLAAVALCKSPKPFVQQIVNGIRQMEMSVAHAVQGLEVSLRVCSLVMTLLENVEALSAKGFRKHSHGTAMQQQTLTMHLHRPLRIGAEEERILNQNNRPVGLQAGVIDEQLMWIDNGEFHSQPSPARRQARRPIDVA